MSNKKIKKIVRYLLSYSFEDLAKSFFALNLWLPNVSSPIKSQYLYVILESIHGRLSTKNKICTYEDFKVFSTNLFPLIPSYSMIEDYIPENDWGEIKYFINEEFFKIFYGGDLSNTYDFYYSYEVIHCGFVDYYKEKLQRSPIDELEFCVSIQDEIINSIDVSVQDKREVELAAYVLPSEDFWRVCINFINHFKPEERYPSSLLNEYSKDLIGTRMHKIPSETEFLTKAYDGKNCFYFFLKRKNKYFPVLPRKYFAVLYDKWGSILNENYDLIEKEFKYHEIRIGIQFYHFLKLRFKEEDIFFINSPVDADLKFHKSLFTSAFRSRNNLILIHVLPPRESKTQQKILNSLTKELREAQELVSKPLTRIGLHGENQIVQFESHKNPGLGLNSIIFTVIPHCTTGYGGIIGQPNDLPGEIIGLDQLLGIFDEIKNLDEFADFWGYAERMRSSFGISPMSSYLDLFGSYRDSSGVLIPGASVPDFVIVDPHWGSGFRYRSLSEFWKKYPEENFFGHPRSWSIDEKRKLKEVVVLKSRSFFGYVYCCPLGDTWFFINAPVDSLSFDQGRFTDMMMHSLADALTLYRGIIDGLSFTKNKNKLQALFFPVSLIKSNEKFKHLMHLLPAHELWTMDIMRLKRGDYAVRVVFDDEQILTSLKDARDRSIQVQLLIDILREINLIFDDPTFEQSVTNLAKEKDQKNRFRTHAFRKKVSFPEFAKYSVPEKRDYKLADKKIAEIARDNGIESGEYEGQKAKEIVNLLKSKLIEFLNTEVSQFDIRMAIPTLIGNADSLINEYEFKSINIKKSLDQEVDFQREVFLGEDKQHFLHHHKNYRYLIEKFVQLQPRGGKDFENSQINYLLGFVDRLLSLYLVSDFLHYGLFPSKISIDHDFLVNLNYGAEIDKMQTEWVEEQAKINLSMIGNKDDSLSIPFEIVPFLEEIDRQCERDLGFSWKDMINIQQILASWTTYHENAKEAVSYKATLEEIKNACIKGISGFDASKIRDILDFLTLDSTKILVIEDDNRVPPDLPIWEYRKRATRYTIRPLIKIESFYHWGAHSAERSARVWTGITDLYKLPADIKAPSVTWVLQKAHTAVEKSLQEKIEAIVGRFTSDVETGVFPHQTGLCSENIGDIDVFAFLRKENIILNIESKMIDNAYCHKDLKRIAEKIFGRIKTSDSVFQNGYLQMVEKREQFLNQLGKELAEKYWAPLEKNPKVISIFVTGSSYLWTKYPPIVTNVNFVELTLLDDFLKSLSKHQHPPILK